VAKKRVAQTNGPESEPRPEPEPDRLDLQTKHIQEPLSPTTKRFDVFLIDSCWNGPVSRVVREHVPHIHQLHPHDSLYILDRQQSLEVIRILPELIGKDPVILVYDLYSGNASHKNRYRGFRLCLGLFRNGEQALAKLQEFVRFIAEHRTAHNLQAEVLRVLHREGFEGMIKVLTETSSELLG
jgi:hypothetical protein